MKKLMLATTAIAGLASPTFAGGLGDVAVEPMPVYAPALVTTMHDWSGAYVGLSYGKTSADIDFSTSGGFDFEDGTVAGIYGGYLAQRGSFVFGGELAYGKLSDTNIAGFSDENEIEHVLDLKGRAGFAADRALFYGVLGYSKATYVEPGIIPREFDLDGMSYGIGAEFAFTQQFVVGLEYLTRDLSGSASDDPSVTGDANLDTVSLRLGFSF